MTTNDGSGDAPEYEMEPLDDLYREVMPNDESGDGMSIAERALSLLRDEWQRDLRAALESIVQIADAPWSPEGEHLRLQAIRHAAAKGLADAQQ